MADARHSAYCEGAWDHFSRDGMEQLDESDQQTDPLPESCLRIRDDPDRRGSEALRRTLTPFQLSGRQKNWYRRNRSTEHKPCSGRVRGPRLPQRQAGIAVSS